MTVGKLFVWIMRLMAMIIAPYWLIHLYILNDGLNTFKVSFDSQPLFVLSFIMSIIVGGFLFITFIIYLAHNNQKSVAIVFSYKYLRENYWKDVNKAFAI